MRTTRLPDYKAQRSQPASAHRISPFTFVTLLAASYFIATILIG